MKLFQAFQQMEELCRKEQGAGLAAVQVGLPWNMFIYKTPMNDYECYVDCRYEDAGAGKSNSIEGCLSLKTEDGKMRHFKVARFNKVKVTGKRLVTDPELKLIDFEETLSGLEGVVFQHELDHANDVLISEIGEEMFFSKV